MHSFEHCVVLLCRNRNLFAKHYFLSGVLKSTCIVCCCRPQSFGKVMFSQACVKNSVHGGEAYTPHPGRHPLGRHPPGRHPPPWTDTPHIRLPLQWTVRILLECIPVTITFIFPFTINLIHCSEPYVAA